MSLIDTPPKKRKGGGKLKPTFQLFDAVDRLHTR